MDLWIRSSDKEMLLKANKIKYGHYKPFMSDYYTEVISINDELIEEYKTKERALEVLDEIENALLNRWANNVKYEEHYDDEEPRSLVYQMPKE